MPEENKPQETEEQSQQQGQAKPQNQDQASTANATVAEDEVVGYSEPSDGSGGTTR
jgi:hypothetical protein